MGTAPAKVQAGAASPRSEGTGQSSVRLRVIQTGAVRARTGTDTKVSGAPVSPTEAGGREAVGLVLEVTVPSPALAVSAGMDQGHRQVWQSGGGRDIGLAVAASASSRFPFCGELPATTRRPQAHQEPPGPPAPELTVRCPLNSGSGLPHQRLSACFPATLGPGRTCASLPAAGAGPGDVQGH